MKITFTLMLLVITGAACAQKIPDMTLYKVRLYEKDKTILAEINEINSGPHIKPARFYYWYSANAIHSTQGGYSGKLLNGVYTEYYLNKNVKEQGTFNKGLKTGLWKSWNEDGTLNHAARWKNGVVIAGGRASFFKRLLPFKWLNRRHADSLKTPNNTIKH
ncbi:MAG: hypothetical protein JWP94_471 [Mucilaginibacter sp.]|nr:hypothetical protein [Mucilaginibacter sp.]